MKAESAVAASVPAGFGQIEQHGLSGTAKLIRERSVVPSDGDEHVRESGDEVVRE